jgi:hypothetical protein
MSLQWKTIASGIRELWPEGPVIVSTADTGGRHFLLPTMDMWTEVFAVPGKRTTGTGAANFAVVPPGWTGTLPRDFERIDAPTPFVWIIGRTQTNGVKDYDAVHRIQDGYRITLLANWGKTEVMKSNPPHVTDWSIVARMKRIGLEPGKSFDASKAGGDVLVKGAADGLKLMHEKAPTIARRVNGWQMNTDTMGVYGNYYLKRAIVAMGGLGAVQPEDAICHP